MVEFHSLIEILASFGLDRELTILMTLLTVVKFRTWVVWTDHM